jgi:adenosyl cobinamide kinase/adenosyl cobinamide phosphate guanylyltransferase
MSISGFAKHFQEKIHKHNDLHYFGSGEVIQVSMRGRITQHQKSGPEYLEQRLSFCCYVAED